MIDLEPGYHFSESLVSLSLGQMDLTYVRVELCPLTSSHVEVLTPRTSECELIWK